MRKVLLTGFPHGGTTWVGQSLASSPFVRYIDEPFNPARKNALSASCESFATKDAYISVGSDEPMALSALKTLTNRGGSIRNPGRLSGEALRSVLATGTLVKDPFAFFLLPWISRATDLQPVVLLRHPAGVVAGFLRMGWNCRPRRLLDQPQLVSEVLRPSGMVDLIDEQPETADNLIERVSMMWLARARALQMWIDDHPDWLVIRLEDLAAEPFDEMSSLLDRLGLHRSKRHLAALTGPGVVSEGAIGDRVHVLGRDSSAAAWGWRDRLTAAQIVPIRAITGQEAAAVGYSDDSWA